VSEQLWKGNWRREKIEKKKRKIEEMEKKIEEIQERREKERVGEITTPWIEGKEPQQQLLRILTEPAKVGRNSISIVL
jgi:uncharacterized protein YacL (UPF0231 family)